MKTLALAFGQLLLVLTLTAQSGQSSFFTSANSFFSSAVAEGLVDYAQLKTAPEPLGRLREQIAAYDLTNETPAARQAFYINAYNILVIAQIVEQYPVNSPLEVDGFFDRTTFTVAGEQLTLNQLEKEKLLRTYGDARFHFVLVCGALDCPPIIAEAYLPATLETQLERQTRLALNDADFIRVTGAEVSLSQIFEWYAADFGGKEKEIRRFINRYRSAPLPETKLRFYEYDWSLNQQLPAALTNDPLVVDDSNNAFRYVVSAAIPTGSFEIKGFSNLYTQVTGGGEDRASEQATFFTQNLSVLYGVNNRFNAGFDLRYRQVSFGPESDSRLAVFNLEQTATTRQGLTGAGPKIRYAPFAALPNFSVQSTYWFATDDQLAGTAERPFIDFNGDTWFTQIFNDFSLGDNFSLFTELDILWEDIGAEDQGHINRFSTPVQVIFSYFPNPKTTLYTIGSYSPYWQQDFDYFYQAGLGAKYQITPRLEAELLYTEFRNQFIRSTNGTASTLNFGLRISVF